MIVSSAALVVVAALAVYLIFKQVTAQRRLPPGPKPLPILGNVRDFPPADIPEYQHWLKHKDLYGPISSVSVMGTTIVLIHDRKMAHDLLDSMALKTSGRPTMVMAGQLCGYESITLCQGYTAKFRRSRKLMHKELGTKTAAAKFQPTQEIETKRQMVRALRDPTGWLEHFRKTAAATTLKTTYDYKIETDKPDALVDLIELMMTSFSEIAAPMTYLVDAIPALQYVPDWFPGTGFKQTAKKFRKQVMDGVYLPYHFTKQQMATQNYEESFVSRLVHQCILDSPDKASLTPEDEDAIIWASASLYGAAADTTAITMTAYTLAMIMWPEVQKKAQAEIDRVVGSDRLPTFEDRQNMPYIEAIIKESLRWWPVATMGFPHEATEDIEYEGYQIPKGALLLPAAWWFTHDPAVYPNPEKFDPDRFMAPRNELDPCSVVFGFGRRACPGKHLADAALFLNIAQSLACYRLSKAMGKDGKVLEPKVQSQPGVLHYVPNFPFTVEPRSPEHLALIERTETELPPEGGDSHKLRLDK